MNCVLPISGWLCYLLLAAQQIPAAPMPMRPHVWLIRRANGRQRTMNAKRQRRKKISAVGKDNSTSPPQSECAHNDARNKC